MVVGAARRPEHPGGHLDDEPPPQDGLAPNGVHQGHRLDGSTPESLHAAGVRVGDGAFLWSGDASSGVVLRLGWTVCLLCWTGVGAPLWSARSARRSASFALGAAMCCRHMRWVCPVGFPRFLHDFIRRLGNVKSQHNFATRSFAPHHASCMDLWE
ncbi:hypothetical protein OsJ_36022 [Oryza sativa Japonica Group]|uniref:Uncharacterized protein n=2 Tax=Oryza sativa subsp. japonica TaxID=39947 RepID=A0A8J8Y2G7_ORYSJ|nr:hypothetical protein LOC_Os12g27720 [Oryza sativa Japonica Group]EAZ20413.1 hypothetical protein OsJ_36022 [Oryza sativa Japonica Group]